MKNALALFLLSLSCLTAHAEWVYWTVDFTETDTYPWTEAPTTAWLSIYKSSTRTEANKALVYKDMPTGVDDGTLLTSESSFDFEGDNPDFKTQLSGDVVAKLGGEWSSYLFYIELGNSLGGTPSWTSEGMTYAQLQDLGAVITSDGDPTQYAKFTRWTVGAESVPEPTSGVLLLIGASLLALRRRGRQV